MINLKDFMEVCNYRISEGSEFCWSCFGPNAYRLDSWNGEHDGHTVGIVFDTKTQEVYQFEVCDYAKNRAYRWTNPEYLEAHDNEATSRDVDGNQAWDDVNYVPLEVSADILEKARAIVAGEEYDTRVQIEITLEEDMIFALMRMAHERDITFNQLVEDILKEEIERRKQS